MQVYSLAVYCSQNVLVFSRHASQTVVYEYKLCGLLADTCRLLWHSVGCQLSTRSLPILISRQSQFWSVKFITNGNYNPYPRISLLTSMYNWTGVVATVGYIGSSLFSFINDLYQFIIFHSFCIAQLSTVNPIHYWNLPIQ